MRRIKRLFAAGLIFIALLSVGIVGTLVLRSTVDEVEKRIAEIQKTALEGGSTSAEAFFDFWEERRELTSVFVNHERVDEIGRLAAEMVSAELADDRERLFEAANEILYIVRGIAEDERLSLYSLL